MKTIVIRPLTSELSSDYLDFFDTFIKKQDLLKLPGKKNKQSCVKYCNS